MSVHPLKQLWPSKGFILALALLGVGAIATKPTLRWFKAQYDISQGRKVVLTATAAEHQQLLAQIQAQQSRQRLALQRADDAPLSEQIFQAALSPELLGRSSRYEPYTHNGKLACVWMVNMVLSEVLGERVGANPLFVPSMVEELDSGRGAAAQPGGNFARGFGNFQWHGL